MVQGGENDGRSAGARKKGEPWIITSWECPFERNYLAWTSTPFLSFPSSLLFFNRKQGDTN